MQKAVELCGHAALPAAADKIHQFVHQDQYGLVFGQERPDDVATRRNALLFMFRKNRKGFFTTKLESDFAPRRPPRSGSVGTAAASNGVEFGTDEYGDFGRRYRVESGDLEQSGYSLPLPRSWTVIR